MRHPECMYTKAIQRVMTGHMHVQKRSESCVVKVTACGSLRVFVYGCRCCQQLRGGLRDKPGKSVDYYHTCYCLSGLSTAQHASNAVCTRKHTHAHARTQAPGV